MLLFSLLLLGLCGCYHGIQETLICPRLSLPDSVKAQGMGRYYDKTIDVDWLDNEIPGDSVETFIQRIIPEHYANTSLKAGQKEKLIAETVEQSIKKWKAFKKSIWGNYRVAYYHKAWFYSGSAAGLVLIKDCVIIGDIHFPEVAYWSGEIIQ